VKYLGTIISKEDPGKVSAISNMPVPTDNHLLGMVNFLADHIPKMSNITVSLRDLVKELRHTFSLGP